LRGAEIDGLRRGAEGLAGLDADLAASSLGRNGSRWSRRPRAHRRGKAPACTDRKQIRRFRRVAVLRVELALQQLADEGGRAGVGSIPVTSLISTC
jgi:hypothetical protein